MSDQIERWKRFLLTVDDDVFFNVIRNYLGPVQTPFNKHNLVDRLVAFLQKDEIRHDIVGLLTPENLDCISAVDMIKPQSFAELLGFLGDSANPGDLYQQILNLMDRLVLYRDSEDRSFLINPLLRDDLITAGMGTQRLFETRDASRIRAVIPWLNDSLVQAALSLVSENPLIEKADGKLRKAVIQLFQERCASTVQGSAEENDLLLHTLLRSFSLNGLLIHAGDQSRVHQGRLAEWAGLAALQRHFYYWAAYILAAEESDAPVLENYESRSAFSTGEDIRAASSQLYRILSILPRDRTLNKSGIQRFIQLHMGKQDRSFRMKTLFRVLLDLNLLCEHDGFYTINPAIADQMDREANSIPGPTAIVQSDYTITLQPNAEFRHSSILALATRLVRYDIVSTYEIQKDAVHRALSLGISGSSILDALSALTGQLPQNIEFSISGWISEFSNVTLTPGYLIQCSESSRSVIRHLADSRDDVLTISDGVFLFPSGDTSWVDDLEAAGIPARRQIQGNGSGERSFPPIIPFNESGRRRTPGLFSAASRGSTQENKAPDELEKQKRMDSMKELVESRGYPEDIKKELLLRIQNGLILREDLIDEKMIRPTITEARGLNYNAKLRLIEMAISDGDMLEFLQSGASRPMILKPVKIHKMQGAQSDLLEARQIPGDDSLSVHISKARVLRRLRGSLFTRL